MVIMMDIAFKRDEKDVYISNDGIVYLLGSNQCGKSYVLSILKNGFNGKNKDFLVNNLLVDKNKFNVIYYDDTTDFNEEFKFTKTNLFRELIYSSVLNNINETKLLKDVNDLFDRVDVKVNQYLDINVNKKQEEKMIFDIDITDVNEIIDKFTNIYVDNFLIKDANIPRSTKRKLIYNLLLFELNKKKDLENIVLIDNFDLYLDIENTNKIISMLNEYHKKNSNTYFFLTSNNNIFNLVENKKDIYHVYYNGVTHIFDFDEIIQKSLLKVYYEESDCNECFEDFCIKNTILFSEEIEQRKKEIICNYQSEIGKLYVSSKVRLLDKYNYKYNDVCIYCKDKFFQYFYGEIYRKLNEIIDLSD